ncbi:MAG: DUF3179 domain-containing protein [Gemmatimonadota bacterium]
MDKGTLITLVILGLAAGLGLHPGSSAADGDPSLPFSDTPYYLADDIAAYRSFMMSGGPPLDGIPAIDDPRFIDADEADMDPGEMVIGFYHEGEARAYPQLIVVQHEIVNDEVGGLAVAITYCPLTATAQGFRRGDTTLGVSGQLLNSNVVMFDRETRSYFSQIAGTGIRGEHEGRTLDEVNLIWTTWERWRSAHPDTKVLSERTGHLRNYNRDPYGSYNPVGGYYALDGTIFPLMHTSDRHHDKEMVVGGRTSQQAVYFVLAELRRDEIQHTDDFVGVYDPIYDTGYIYETGGMEVDVTPLGDGRYGVDGEGYAAADLPLESVIPVEAFHFAWHAFYPESQRP